MLGKIRVRVLAGKRFDMENMKMSQIYVEGGLIEEDNRCGCPPMKLNGDFEVLDQLRGYLPGEFDLDVEFRQGAQDKMQQYCVGATPVPASEKIQSSKASAS